MSLGTSEGERLLDVTCVSAREKLILTEMRSKNHKHEWEDVQRNKSKEIFYLLEYFLEFFFFFFWLSCRTGRAWCGAGMPQHSIMVLLLHIH